MIITTLYHRVGQGKYATELNDFKAHLHWIKTHSQTLLPGEKAIGINFCLTFDDATIDFYETVFPLLSELKLKALLAVPTKFMIEKRKGYCHFSHLKEIVKNPLIEIASHTHSHLDLTTLSTRELKRELILSQLLLEDKLGIHAKTLVFPYGKCSSRVFKESRLQYQYLMRIGSAINFNWKGVIYRIVADGLTKENFPLPIKSSYFIRYGVNRLRRR
ncbi:MAG: polysaccharide deacetylase family protein [Simkaniaceae bacterium]